MPQPPALDPMLSLTTAARLAYKAAMNREAGEQTLNTVARMIASRFSVFASADRESHANPARIMPDEVFEGDFQRGGDTLNFKVVDMAAWAVSSNPQMHGKIRRR